MELKRLGVQCKLARLSTSISCAMVAIWTKSDSQVNIWHFTKCHFDWTCRAATCVCVCQCIVRSATFECYFAFDRHTGQNMGARVLVFRDRHSHEGKRQKYFKINCKWRRFIIESWTNTWILNPKHYRAVDWTYYLVVRQINSTKCPSIARQIPRNWFSVRKYCHWLSALLHPAHTYTLS